MDNMKKIVVAQCIENVSSFLNEALSTQVTQRSAMGEYKKFAIALTNVGLPSLIAFDLVATSPMTSISGSVAYVEYQKGTTKGASAAGDKTNDIWSLGTMDTNYSGNAVVEVVTDGQSAPSFDTAVAGAMVNPETNVGYAYKVMVTTSGSTVTTYTDTFPSYASGSTTKVAYIYDNIKVPQTEGKLPTLVATLKNVALEAKARRIAIYYSQMAAFQAKTDYGFNLADGLAEQAVGQLSYEIDSEIVDMLYNAATADASIADFNKAMRTGVSLADQYAGFAAKIEEYKMAIYDRTKKFAPNYMVVASNIMPVLSFVPGFQAANVSQINGPYFAGTIGGMKVFVSPMIPANEFFFGVNQGAMQATAGIYCPYMAVCPTQLLEMADGLNQQGWATLYDAKVLNADLLIKGKIVETA